MPTSKNWSFFKTE